MNTSFTPKHFAWLFLVFLLGVFVGTLQTYTALHLNDINTWFNPVVKAPLSPVPTKRLTPTPTETATPTPSETPTPVPFRPVRRISSPSATIQP